MPKRSPALAAPRPSAPAPASRSPSWTTPADCCTCSAWTAPKAHAADLAHRKARTAAALGLSTAILEQMASEGRLPATDVLALGGGLPLLRDGHCAGAIGVSGATSEVDEAIAAAGVTVLE